MSGHRALVAGDNEILGRIGLRDRRATAGFRPGLALGPISLRWIRSMLPGEEGTAWWAEVTSCLAETLDLGQRRQLRAQLTTPTTCAAIAGRCRSWSGPAGRPGFVA
jgi:hypothetical protein